MYPTKQYFRLFRTSSAKAARLQRMSGAEYVVQSRCRAAANWEERGAHHCSNELARFATDRQCTTPHLQHGTGSPRNTYQLRR